MTTENLGFLLVDTNMLAPDLPVNRDLQVLDAVAFGCRVEEIGLTTPPTTVTADIGKAWIVGASATGRWATHDDAVAVCISPLTDHFIEAQEGMEVWDKDTGGFYLYDSGTWTLIATGADPSPNVSVLTPASGVVTIDCSLGDYFTLAPTANVTSIVFTNLPGSGKGATKMVRFTQDTTARTVAWPSSFRWEGAAPSVSTASGSVDVLAITTFDNGTKWDATLSKGRV